MLAIAYVFIPILMKARTLSTEYDIVRVRWNQLEEFYAFCTQLFGEDIADFHRVREWYSKNPNVLYAIYSLRHFGFVTKSKLVGCFSVFPVTKDAKELLERNELKGTELRATQITRPECGAAALYIGAIGASGFRAKQETLAALLGYVHSRTNKRTHVVFTRPITKDGMRLAKKHGFEPVLKSASEEADMIFFRDFGDH